MSNSFPIPQALIFKPENRTLSFLIPYSWQNMCFYPAMPHKRRNDYPGSYSADS